MLLMRMKRMYDVSWIIGFKICEAQYFNYIWIKVSQILKILYIFLQKNFRNKIYIVKGYAYFLA